MRMLFASLAMLMALNFLGACARVEPHHYDDDHRPLRRHCPPGIPCR